MQLQDEYMIQFKINMALVQMESTINFLQASIRSPISKETEMLLAFLHNMLGAHHARIENICQQLAANADN